MTGQSSLLLAPPGSFQGTILFEMAFSYAVSSPVIVLCNLETEMGTVREQYSRWCQARELELSQNLHAVHGTWKCATIEALRDTISGQVHKAVMNNPKLLVVRDLSIGATVDPNFQWFPLASGLSQALHCKVITAAHFGGRSRIPQGELNSYPVDDIMRVELGYDLKVTLYPQSGEPIEYRGTQHRNMAITFDILEKDPAK